MIFGILALGALIFAGVFVLAIAYAVLAELASVPLSLLRDAIDRRIGDDGLTRRERKTLAARYRAAVGYPSLTAEQSAIVSEFVESRRRLRSTRGTGEVKPIQTDRPAP